MVDLEWDLNPNPSADPGRVRLVGGGGDGGRRVGFQGNAAGDGRWSGGPDRTDRSERESEGRVLDRTMRRVEERRGRCRGESESRHFFFPCRRFVRRFEMSFSFFFVLVFGLGCCSVWLVEKRGRWRGNWKGTCFVSFIRGLKNFIIREDRRSDIYAEVGSNVYVAREGRGRYWKESFQTSSDKCLFDWWALSKGEIKNNYLKAQQVKNIFEGPNIH